MNDAASPPYQYQDRFLAFIDILGFGQFVQSRKDSPSEVIKKVRDVYEKLYNRLNQARTSDIDINFSMFSDSVVISKVVGDDDEAKKDSIQELVWCVNQVVVELLSCGFLTRGAIVRGQIVHEDQFIVGPALINAYKLETMTATYPRIIIVGSAKEILSQTEAGWIKTSPDGPYFVHTLSDLEKSVKTIEQLGHDNFLQSESMRIIQDCYETIRDRVEESRDSPKHFSYNKWFAEYFCRSVLKDGPKQLKEWPKAIEFYFS